MDGAAALLMTWLNDSGQEVTAIALSTELHVPLIVAKKLLYSQLQQLLWRGDSFFVCFVETKDNATKLHRVLVTSPLLPPLESLYSAQRATLSAAPTTAATGNPTAAAPGSRCCVRSEFEPERSHLTWQVECRSLAAAFSAKLKLHHAQLFVPPFAAVRQHRLRRRLPHRAAVAPEVIGGAVARTGDAAAAAAGATAADAGATTAAAATRKATPAASEPHHHGCAQREGAAERSSSSSNHDAGALNVKRQGAASKAQQRLSVASSPKSCRPVATTAAENTAVDAPPATRATAATGVDAEASPGGHNVVKRSLSKCALRPQKKPKKQQQGEQGHPRQESEPLSSLFADEEQLGKSQQIVTEKPPPAISDITRISSSSNIQAGCTGGNADTYKDVLVKERVSGSRCYQEGGYLVFEDFSEMQPKVVAAADAASHKEQKLPSAPAVPAGVFLILGEMIFRNFYSNVIQQQAARGFALQPSDAFDLRVK
ncbi:hypothetical protein Efla_006806 [Eimeria flavescens]